MMTIRDLVQKSTRAEKDAVLEELLEEVRAIYPGKQVIPLTEQQGHSTYLLSIHTSQIENEASWAALTQEERDILSQPISNLNDTLDEAELAD